MSCGIDEVISAFGYPSLPPGFSRNDFWVVLFKELDLRPVADLSEAKSVHEAVAADIWLRSCDELQKAGQFVPEAVRRDMEDLYDSSCEQSTVSRDTQPEKRRTPMCFDLVATDMADEDGTDTTTKR